MAWTVGALLGAGSVARAGTFTWTGNTNANWSIGTNWMGGNPPSTGDDVIVSGANPMSINTGSTLTVKTFTMSGTNVVTQNASTPFHVSQTFTASGGSFTASGSSTVQIDGAATIQGATFNSNGTTLTVGGLAVSSGTFNGNNATIVDTGGLSISGGAFTASTGTMQIAGAFSHTAGTFNDNGGTFLFNSSTSRSHTFGGASMPTVIINDGLAAYWTLDDGSGNPADSSGYGNTLTRSSALTYATTVSSTITFSDPDMITFSGNYASNTTPTAMPAPNAAQTISLWAQFASSTSTQAMLALTGTSSAIVLGLGSVSGTGSIRVWKNSGADLAHLTAPTDGKWHHIAYTTSGSTDLLYLDGVATAGLGTSHDSAAVTAVFLAASSAGTNLFNGSLDDVRIYNRALTAREVTDLAFGQAPSTGVATHTFSDAFTTATGNDLVIASGVVAGTAAVTVGGSWLNYGGRFTNTTGTITLNTANNRTLLTGGQPFANLTVNATGVYTTADRLWMPGKTLNISGQAGSLTPGATMTVGAINDTTSNSNGLAAGTGTVVIDGTSDLALEERNFWGLRIEDPSETGLVSYWKLDEGQYTTVRDYVGANNGTLSSSGATWTSAPAGITFDDAAAIKLNGTTGSVSLGTTTSLPSSTSAQTISLWFNLGSTSGTQDFVALGDGSHGIKIGLNGGVLAAYTWGGTSLITATTPAAGGWHNVVFSYDGTNNNFYLDGVAVAPTTTAHQSATITVAALGSYDGSHEMFNGSLDDVRVYNTALTAAQIGQLAKGRYAGTGGVATVTQTGVRMVIPSTTGFGFVLDSGNYYTNGQIVTVSALTRPCIVYSGTLRIGAAVMNCDGGLTINPMGTLLMDVSSSQFQPGKNSVVAIDGAFTASSTGALISRDNNGETYSFQIGTFSGSTPVLDITGLEVRFTDTNGLQIDNLAGVATGATTTYKHLDNILFRQAPAGGAQMLEIYSKTLNLSSSGCTFGKNADNNFATVAVKVIGNGTGDGETRAIFGGTTCQSNSGAWTGGGADKICVAAAKSDDDSDGNGIADSGTAGTNGAIAQFVRAAEDDTAGTIVGLPTAAFNWNTFAYYSTYVAFHNGAAKDVIYVRDETGAPLYSWTVPNAGETITGTPQWNSVTASGVTTHYLFVATSAGNVYKLVDTATGDATGTLSLDTVSTGWKVKNPFPCSCTISTPLGMDASNLYWGSTTSGKNFWTLGQATQSGPLTISFGQAVTNTGISVATISATTYAFMGVTGAVLQISTAGNSVSATNSSPGTHAVFGRIAVGQGATKRVYAGDDGGTMWAIDPTTATTFGGAPLWSFNTANAIKSSPYWDNGTDTVQYGTQGGTIIVLTGSGATLNQANSAYPYTPAGGAGDPITSAPLYYSGVLAIGSTGGKLYFIDRSTGVAATPVKIIREYQFGSSEAVSGIGFDPTANRYMVSTASSSGDGRLYYIDLIADPTPTFL